MKTIFILLNLSLAFTCAAQSSQLIIDGVDVNEMDIRFIEIIGSEDVFSQRVVVSVYYGQPMGWGDNQQIKGADGRNMKFNGMIDALNFLYKKGWDFISAHVDTTSYPHINHYILKRKLEYEDENNE